MLLSGLVSPGRGPDADVQLVSVRLSVLLRNFFI